MCDGDSADTKRNTVSFVYYHLVCVHTINTFKYIEYNISVATHVFEQLGDIVIPCSNA